MIGGTLLAGRKMYNNHLVKTGQASANLQARYKYGSQKQQAMFRKGQGIQDSTRQLTSQQQIADARSQAQTTTTLDNIKSLGYQNNTNVTNLDYKLALNNYRTKFDLIFLDPPYKLDCCNEIIFAIENKDLLTPDGLIVCEVDSNTIINETDNFEICKEREYGIRKVYILRRR